MYKPIGVALRAALLVMLVVMLGLAVSPQSRVLADSTTDNDKNASVDISAEPDATGVNVLVTICSKLSKPLGFELKVLVPDGATYQASWAGNPNANHGTYSGIDVSWIGSVPKAGCQAPFVTRFSGNTPFLTRAHVSYTGDVKGELLSRDLVTGGIGGLKLPPHGGPEDNQLTGYSLLYTTFNSLKGIFDAPTGVKPNQNYAIVGFVDPDSPAYTAGLRDGDIVLTVNGQSINNIFDQYRIYIPIKFGQTVTLQILRDGAKQTLKMKWERYTADVDARYGANFSAALKADPDNLLLRLVQAKSFIESDPDTALKLLDRLITIAPDAAELYAQRGDVYSIYLGDDESAQPDLEQAVELDPANVFAWNDLSWVAYDNKDYATAKKHAQAALKLIPDFAESLYLMGRLAWIGNDAESAIDYYNQALKSDPYYGNIYYWRGVAEEEQGQTSDAAADYRLAIYTANTADSVRLRALEAYNELAE